MRFIDEAIITVRSGKGGRGAVAFRREKFVPKGGPSGGDGGEGGSVLLKPSLDLLTLYDFRHKRVYEAQNGQPGQGSEMNGRAGQDLIIELPVGTVVTQLGPKKPWPEPAKSDAEDEEAAGPQLSWSMNAPIEYDESVEDEILEGEEKDLVDLLDPDKPFLVARGGRGGKGNTHFKSSTMRAPRFAQPGEPGEELRLKLQLKIVADVGLLGLPNAGKSTFISAISAARPKIAPYPFTTLSPVLGVVKDDLGRRMVVADIPGLIEGASRGVGLGHQFLRHVERTRLLVHILSIEDVDLEGPEPWAGFDLVNQELAAYSPELSRRSQIEVVNKIDLKPEAAEALRARATQEGRPVMLMSALTGQGVDEVLAAMWHRVLAAR